MWGLLLLGNNLYTYILVCYSTLMLTDEEKQAEKEANVVKGIFAFLFTGAVIFGLSLIWLEFLQCLGIVKILLPGF